MNFTYANTADGVPLAELLEHGNTLYIYPAGKPGPLLVISPEDWRELVHTVEAVLSNGGSDMARLLPLDGYAAQEGHNGNED